MTRSWTRWWTKLFKLLKHCNINICIIYDPTIGVYEEPGAKRQRRVATMGAVGFVEDFIERIMVFFFIYLDLDQFWINGDFLKISMNLKSDWIGSGWRGCRRGGRIWQYFSKRCWYFS